MRIVSEEFTEVGPDCEGCRIYKNRGSKFYRRLSTNCVQGTMRGS